MSLKTHSSMIWVILANLIPKKNSQQYGATLAQTMEIHRGNKPQDATLLCTSSQSPFLGWWWTSNGTWTLEDTQKQRNLEKSGKTMKNLTNWWIFMNFPNQPYCFAKRLQIPYENSGFTIFDLLQTSQWFRWHSLWPVLSQHQTQNPQQCHGTWILNLLHHHGHSKSLHWSCVRCPLGLPCVMLYLSVWRGIARLTIHNFLLPLRSSASGLVLACFCLLWEMGICMNSSNTIMPKRQILQHC